MSANLNKCLIKHSKALKDFDKSEVIKAAKVYQSRGQTEDEANVSAIEDHLRELEAERDRIENDILDQWKKADPKGYDKAKAATAENEITGEAQQQAEADTRIEKPEKLDTSPERAKESVGSGLKVSAPERAKVDEAPKPKDNDGTLYSFAEETAAPADKSDIASITSALSSNPRAAKWLESGKIKVVESLPSKAQASYDPATKQITLAANALTPDTVKGVLLHEVFHAAAREDKTFAPRVTALLETLGSQLAIAKKMRGGKTAKWLADAETAIPNDTPASRRTEELAAYAIEQYENAPQSLPEAIAKWVRDFMAAVRMVLMKSGLYTPKDVTPADLSAVAKSWLNRGSEDNASDSTVDDGALYSKSKGDADQSPSTAIPANIGKGQPIDRVFRAAFELLRIPKLTIAANAKFSSALTTAKFSETGRFSFMNPMLENARAGLLDRYGLAPDYIARDAGRQSDERNVIAQATDILGKLKKANMGAAEAKVMQAILTGQKIEGSEWNKLAEPIRLAIDELGQQALALNLISQESYDRNKGAYLHRVYLKHESTMTPLVKWVSAGMDKRRRGIAGNTFKGRGMNEVVDPTRLFRDLPKAWVDANRDALKGLKFTILDKIEDDKVKRRVYWPSDLAMPNEYSEFKNKGEWEVRSVVNGNLILWRDFTKEERNSMGEILDARYTIAKTFMSLAQDLSSAKFFRDIAANPEWASATEPTEGVIVTAERAGRLSTGADWVLVPETKISTKSDIKKWGDLSGKWVRAEIWRDINELDKMHQSGMWDKLLRQWKLNKTARNPVVHMNNVMSNLVLMDLGDVRARDLLDGIRSVAKQDEHYKDAKKHGAFGGSFANEELRRTVLKPILAELEAQAKKGIKETNIQQLIGILKKLYSPIGYADDKLIGAYNVEDEVFRMATYMRRLSIGDPPATAAKIANEQFINYDIRAPWVNAARRTVLPFAAYTYRAVPLLAQAIAHKPWKLAKYATIAYTANALAYMLAPGDEEEERKSMREQIQGKTWLGAPRMLRLPARDENNNPLFWDIRGGIPAGNIFDINQGHGAIPIPAPLQFGGPLILASEFFLNKQAFNGKPITGITDDWKDKSVNVSDWAWKAWMPSAPWIPNSYYWDKIKLAATGGRDSVGRDYDLPSAIASSVGIKISPVDVGYNMQMKAWELQQAERALKFEIQQLQQDFQRSLISKEVFARDIKTLTEKRVRLANRTRETFTKSKDSN